MGDSLTSEAERLADERRTLEAEIEALRARLRQVVDECDALEDKLKPLRFRRQKRDA